MTSAPILPAYPRRHDRKPSLLRFFALVHESSISTYAHSAFVTDIIERRVLWNRIIIANAPDVIGHVLLDNAGNYTRSRLLRSLLEPGLGQGLLTAEGETWKRQRRLLAPAFTARRVAEFVPGMTRQTQRLLALWGRDAPRGPRDLALDFSALTLAIISEAMFSVVNDPAISLVGQAVAQYQQVMRPSKLDLLGLPGWLPRPRRRQAARLFAGADAVIRGMIDSRRQAPGPDDLLAMLINARDEDSSGLSDQEIRDQVATIFTAGHETTANLLTWAAYLLALHPVEAQRLTDELDHVLGGRVPVAEDLPNLVYTRRVLDETMRLYPPAHSFSRQALAPDRLRKTELPAGTTVMIVPWLLHRHRRLWPDADLFNPDRFTPEAIASRPRFAYIPFGGGPHICIGASFAITEAVLILAMLAQSWRFRLAPDAVIEPVGLITLRPKHGMPIVLERR